jgi:cyclopropane fatty-acyl-phospholipid synthase-like methyltransferase
VACLAELAGGGGLLEMGIGTGRLALPLRARGVQVQGIEASPAMVAELRRRPGGAEIPVAVGSFADTKLPSSRFSVVVLALHTIFGLPTHDEKIRCFANAEQHLDEGGVFVVEATILDVGAFRQGQAVIPRYMSPEHVELQVLRYDSATQSVDTTNVHLSGDGVRLNSFRNAYASPQELDLMARLGGLRLRERWGSWTREPFTHESTRHVSVYVRPR